MKGLIAFQWKCVLERTKKEIPMVDVRAGELSPYLDVDEEATDYFQGLVDDLLLRIFSFVPARSLMSASDVSRRWRRLARNPSLWLHPKVYFKNTESFLNSESCVRELMRLLRSAPCESFDRLEVSFGISDPPSLHDAILADRRTVRSLFVAFEVRDAHKVTSLLTKHRCSLEELHVMPYDSLNPRPYERWSSSSSLHEYPEHHVLTEIWHEFTKMESLRSLSVNRSLLVQYRPYDLKLETLQINSWTGILSGCLVFFNRASLRRVWVGGSCTDDDHDLAVLGECPLLEEVAVPCVTDLTFLERCPRLTRLRVVDGPSTGARFAAFLRESELSRRLTALSLRRVEDRLLDVVASGALPRLRVLSIQQCFNIPSFSRVLSGVPQLEELSLTYPYFNTYEVQLLRQLSADILLVPRLRVLRLSGGCGHGPGGFQLCLRKEAANVCSHRPHLRLFFSEECPCKTPKDSEVGSAVRSLLLIVNKKMDFVESLFKECKELWSDVDAPDRGMQ